MSGTTKTPVYLVQLEGGGDCYLALVTKEIYDWINAKPSPAVAKELRETHSSEDDCVPASLKAALQKEFGQKDEEGVHVTSGSYENDKALAARHACVTGKHFDHFPELHEWLKEHPEYELQKDDYQGNIY